jgi:exodeoxyribonuclease V alpha subunit
MADVVDTAPPLDPSDVRLARRATGPLRTFNVAGVLTAADVHVARRLGELGGEADPDVLLAVAFAVRAPRLAHVCVDLATVRHTATSELEEAVDVEALPWPDVAGWLTAVAASPLVTLDGSDRRPLCLEGGRLYLDRYWRQELAIAAGLTARGGPAPGVDGDALEAGLDRLFAAGDDDRQRAAASAAVRYGFAVVAGGPGTGKTTTVARIVALLDEQATASGRRPSRIALAAPTGKAAARLEEAVHDAARTMPLDPAVRARLLATPAVTLHRLLGWRPGTRSRFRHDRTNRLPHDVVIVDETSMVSTSMMANLVDAVGTDARLILVGDPDQLASVEAGAVLGDIVGPALDPVAPVPDSPVAGGIVVLRHVHRYGGAIADLAAAVQRGDADAVVEVLAAPGSNVGWIRLDDAGPSGERADPVADPDAAVWAPVRSRVVDAGRRLTVAAEHGDAPAALRALREVRVLCAHRRGPAGVTQWTAFVEHWLAMAIDGYADGGPWYVGRPLLVTENDHTLRLYNGDTGVLVRRPHGVVAAFERGGSIVELSPRRIAAVDTVHAMTVHKSQGSQFGTVAVVLPEPTSSILTRELLYTAVTRAEEHLVVVGSEASVRTAVGRPIARATGLRERLWPAPGGAPGVHPGVDLEPG